MNPDSTRTPTGTLQWPLPVAGTITSQFGHRVDPITGEVSSHTGTDIACAEGTPILAAADGVITVANGLDSWGAVTVTTSKLTTVVGWKRYTPIAPAFVSPPANKCRPGRSSVMSATLGEPQAASALRGTCKRKQDRRNGVFRDVNCKEKHLQM